MSSGSLLLRSSFCEITPESCFVRFFTILSIFLWRLSYSRSKFIGLDGPFG